MAPSVTVVADQKEVTAAVDKRIAEALASAPAEQRVVTIGLSGGSMVAVVAPLLTALPPATAARLRLFVVDERIVPLNDPESNTGAYLSAPLSDALKAAFVVPTNLDDAVKSAVAFESALKATGVEVTPEGLPRFDLLLLGMGPDGHTCSLFPGHDLLAHTGTEWVLPISDSPKPPPQRITLSLAVVNAAKRAVFVTTGSSKAPVLRSIISGTDTSLPAGRVGGAEWIIDQAAASLLSAS